MEKPKKPSPDFPLFPHNNGQWAKKIRGKLHYFGLWEDRDAALERYLDEKDFLIAGRRPPSRDGHTIVEVCERFIEARRADVDTGELSKRTWDDYDRNCKLICELAGSLVLEQMTPDDFRKLRASLGKGVGTTTLGNRVRQARVAFRYLKEIAGVEPNWGTGFREPSAKARRKARAEAGERLHSAAEINAAIAAAKNPQLKAIIYLGINCAFGNEDCARITWDKLDLDGGWHHFERPKTYIPRRAKLWPETVDLLKDIKKKTRSKTVFRTKYKNPWTSTAIAHQAAKVGIEFYNLRRTFRTVADRTLETMAIRLVMGHAANQADMDSRYVQRIEDARLELVADYVRAWLLAG